MAATQSSGFQNEVDRMLEENFRAAFYHFYLKSDKTLNLGIVTVSCWVYRSISVTMLTTELWMS